MSTITTTQPVLTKQDSEAVLDAEEAALLKALAAVKQKKLEREARKSGKRASSKGSGRRRSSSGSAGAKSRAALKVKGGALLKSMQSFAVKKSLSKDGGGNPESPLRVSKNADKERELLDMYLIEECALKTVDSSKVDDPILGLLVAAPIEAAALVKAMKDARGVKVAADASWMYYVGRFGDQTCVVVKSDQSADGVRGAQQACVALRNAWPSARAVLTVGIAWGAVEMGLKFGDVLISTAIQNYDHQRVKPDGSVELISAMYKVSEALTSGLTAPIPGLGIKGIPGLMVASRILLNQGDVTKKMISAVAKHCPGQTVIGGEMEGAGLVAASGLSIPVAVVKAVVDFGGVGEEKGKEHQPSAAVAAVEYLEAAIRRGDWVKKLPIPRGAGLKTLDFSVFIEDKRSGFIGRKGLFTAVEKWRASGKGRVLIVKGDPGIGKSAWASTLVTREADKIAAIHFCRYDDPESLRGGAWLGNVARRLLDWAIAQGESPSIKCDKAVLGRGTGSGAVTDAWKNFLTAFDESVHWTGPPVLIVVDSLDEAVDVGGEDGVQILAALGGGAEAMPAWLKIVVTSRNEAHVLDKIKNSLPGVLEIKSDDKENQADLRQYIAARMGNSATKDDVELVVQAADGNFMYAVQLLRHRAAGDVDQLLKQGAVPTGLQELYSAMAERLFPTESKFVRVLPLLNVLAAAKEALPRKVFDAAMRIVGLKEMEVEAFLVGLQSVLEVSGVVIRIYHKSFGDWLVKTGWRGGDYPVFADLKSGHAVLSQTCAQFWREEHGKRGSYVDSYMCSHAVESNGQGLDAVVKAIGRVDSEAGDYNVGFKQTGRRTLQWMACRAGNEVVVRALVEKHKSDVNLLSNYGDTGLSAAAEQGHIHIVRMLVNEFKCETLDWLNKSALMSAVYLASGNGQADMVRALVKEFGSKSLDQVDKWGRSPVWAAARHGHHHVIRVLVSELGSKMIGTPDEGGRTPLHAVCDRSFVSEEQQIAVTRVLLELGGTKIIDKLDNNGWTPLWAAAAKGRPDLIKMLVEEGKSKALDQADRFHQTPLWMACRNGHTQVVRTLVSLGSKAIDKPNNVRTPLHAAWQYGHSDLVRVLVKELGSKVLDTPEKLFLATPLYISASRGSLEEIRILIDELGSKALDTPDKRGRTPLHIACANGHTEVAKLLLTTYKSKASGLKDKDGKLPVDLEIERRKKD